MTHMRYDITLFKKNFLIMSFVYEKGVQPFLPLVSTYGYRQVTFSYNKHRMVHAL